MSEQAGQDPIVPRFMSIAAFRREGYLQEVNRRFFHPLGLALAVVCKRNGIETLYGVRDERGDPEGFYLPPSDDPIYLERARRIQSEWESRSAARLHALGWMIQPPDTLFSGSPDVSAPEGNVHDG